MKKIALYARVSTTDKNQNPENQLLPMRKRCEREGWEYKEFVDQGSAFKENPKLPARDGLLERARKQEFDAIMVWAIDRWSREEPIKVAHQVFYEIKKGMGIEFMSLNEPFLSTNSMDQSLASIMLQFISWAGSHESRRKSERVRAAYELKKVNNDISKWGRPRINPDLSKISELRSKGASLRSIAIVFEVSKDTIARALSQKSVPILINI